MSAYGLRIDRTTVRFERILPGPIEKVWAYLVEPEKRMKWFCGGSFDLRPGGVASFEFDHRRITDEMPPEGREHHGAEIKFDGEIVAVNPPHLLVFDWPEEDGAKTRVRIELSAQGENVRLILTHSMLEKFETLIDVSGGWHAHLDMLNAALTASPRPSFWEAIVRREAEYRRRYED